MFVTPHSLTFSSLSGSSKTYELFESALQKMVTLLDFVYDCEGGSSSPTALCNNGIELTLAEAIGILNEHKALLEETSKDFLARLLPFPLKRIKTLIPFSYDELVWARSYALSLSLHSSPATKLLGLYLVTAIDLLAEDPSKKELVCCRFICLQYLNQIVTKKDLSEENFSGCTETLFPLSTDPEGVKAIYLTLYEANKKNLLASLTSRLNSSDNQYREARILMVVQAAFALHSQDPRWTSLLVKNSAAKEIFPPLSHLNSLIHLFPHLSNSPSLLHRYLITKEHQAIFNEALDAILSKGAFPPPPPPLLLEEEASCLGTDLLKHIMGYRSECVNDEEYSACKKALALLDKQSLLAIDPTHLRMLYLCAIRRQTPNDMHMWKNHLDLSEKAWSTDFSKQVIKRVLGTKQADSGVAKQLLITVQSNPNAFERDSDFNSFIAHCLFLSKQMLEKNTEIYDEKAAELLIDILATGQSTEEIKKAFANTLSLFLQKTPLCSKMAKTLNSGLAHNDTTPFIDEKMRKKALTNCQSRLCLTHKKKALLSETSLEKRCRNLNNYYLEVAQRSRYPFAQGEIAFVADELNAMYRAPKATKKEHQLCTKLHAQLLNYLCENRDKTFSNKLVVDLCQALVDATLIHQHPYTLQKYCHTILSSLINQNFFEKEGLHFLLTKYLCSRHPPSRMEDYRRSLINAAITVGYYAKKGDDPHYCHLHLTAYLSLPKERVYYDRETIKDLELRLYQLLNEVPFYETYKRQIDNNHNAVMEYLTEKKQTDKN